MLESLQGFPSCPPPSSVLFIECAIIVGIGLLIARGIARVLLKAYHVRTDDPSTTSRHFGAKTKINEYKPPLINSGSPKMGCFYSFTFAVYTLSLQHILCSSPCCKFRSGETQDTGGQGAPAPPPTHTQTHTCTHTLCSSRTLIITICVTTNFPVLTPRQKIKSVCGKHALVGQATHGAPSPTFR